MSRKVEGRISSVRGHRIDVHEVGEGPPLLFLGAGIGNDPGRAAIEILARKFRVIAPSHPGFAGSERPRSITTVDDLSYFYLDLLQEHSLSGAVVVGVSFGGWIASEIAVKSTAHISRLVLADAVGIKIGDRETRDITDVFQITEDNLRKAIFATPAPRVVDYKSMTDAEVLAITQNREALARFAWSPYMHNPKLKDRLHRIAVPTLVLWGAEDGVVSTAYGRAYCAAIPAAAFATIENAGHLAQIDQPEDFARHVLDFTSGALTAKRETTGAA